MIHAVNDSIILLKYSVLCNFFFNKYNVQKTFNKDIY